MKAKSRPNARLTLHRSALAGAIMLTTLGILSSEPYPSVQLRMTGLPTSGETTTLTAELVSERRRVGFLSKRFGPLCHCVEALVYLFARRLVPAYLGGYWHFYEISNGGFFMTPELPATEVVVDSNGFQGHMSAEAIGIVICLFAFSHASFQYANAALSDHYHLLRDFAAEHSEASLIFAAID